MVFDGWVLFNPHSRTLYRDGAGTKFFLSEGDAITYRALSRNNPMMSSAVKDFEAIPATCNVPEEFVPEVKFGP
jgi:hypothetical protein